ncbi:hypothetical protein GBAR_LOCUS7808, partial [Geodia barretti]
KIHHVQSHDYAISYIIIIKSDRLLSTHHTSRPPGGEDRYHAAERPTVVPEDAETFLFHFHGSPVEIATAGCLVPTGVCEFTSSRFPPFFLLTREHVGGTSERRHTRVPTLLGAFCTGRHKLLSVRLSLPDMSVLLASDQDR